MGSEKQGSDRLRAIMHRHGWFTVKIHGSKFLIGFPDLFCWHPRHHLRLIETKVYNGRLRSSQIRFISKAAKYGLEVFVCRDEKDYPVLFGKSNWMEFI